MISVAEEPLPERKDSGNRCRVPAHGGHGVGVAQYVLDFASIFRSSAGG